MAKYERIFEKSVHDVSVHKLAKLNPTMTDEEFNALKLSIKELGQIEPVIMYQGKIVDGRHRLKALKELGIDKIKYKNLHPQMSLEDVRELVVKGYEMRRHLTPTQKAIRAYKEYIRLKDKGEKVSMGEIAEQFGTSRMMMSRAKNLFEYAPKNVIEALENGQKIKLGERGSTDSLYSIVNHYKALGEEAIDSERLNHPDITDEEREFVDSVVQDLKLNYNNQVLKYMADRLYSEMK